MEVNFDEKLAYKILPKEETDVLEFIKTKASETNKCGWVSLSLKTLTVDNHFYIG